MEIIYNQGIPSAYQISSKAKIIQLFLVFSPVLGTIVGDIEDTFSKLAKPLDQVGGAGYGLRAYQMIICCVVNNQL